MAVPINGRVEGGEGQGTTNLTSLAVGTRRLIGAGPAINPFIAMSATRAENGRVHTLLPASCLRLMYPTTNNSQPSFRPRLQGLSTE
ncbi:hypothetical protein VCV18_009136 [Metarhizium anisopliae]